MLHNTKYSRLTLCLKWTSLPLTCITIIGVIELRSTHGASAHDSSHNIHLIKPKWDVMNDWQLCVACAKLMQDSTFSFSLYLSFLISLLSFKESHLSHYSPDLSLFFFLCSHVVLLLKKFSSSILSAKWFFFSLFWYSCLVSLELKFSEMASLTLCSFIASLTEFWEASVLKKNSKGSREPMFFWHWIIGLYTITLLTA